ncbi:MAG: pyridoxal-dependent decarboxylase [Sandaracinaceae bacterium]
MQPGHVVGGRFEIRAVAGRGGMGTVFRGLDRESGLSVAIKVLSDPQQESARFESEAKILGALEHPNIVRYIGHGTTPDRYPYLVLEWLTGIDLAERLLKGPLDIGDTLRLGRVLARALAAAHGRGVVHRDVKPGNVFLVEGRVELAKLFDFGIARSALVSHQHTHPGTALGTPAYMAPEQARGAMDVDARADLFSLGCVLFECLSGRPPFVAEHVIAVLAKVLFEDPPRVSELRPEVPSSLDELIDRLLAKERDARFANASDVVTAIEAIQAGVRRASLVPAEDETAVSITGDEMRLLAVVLSAPPRHGMPADAQTIDASGAASSLTALERIAGSFDARFSPLADGSSAAVMTLSGSAEELALRAARCALALADASHADTTFSVAVGRGVASQRVPTGEVIDRAAASLRREASERASARVRIDDTCAGLLGERFEIGGDRGGLWLLRERELGDSSLQLLGRRSPFVGRDAERALASAAIEGCLDARAPRGLVITGEAGSGKSRLRAEVLSDLERARPSAYEVWVGRADPIAVGAPLGVIGALLMRMAGVTAGEPSEVKQRKLRARVQRSLEAERADHATEFLSELIGAPVTEPSVQLRAARMDPTLMGDQLANAFEELVLAETMERGLVVVLEDMQWGDGPSVRLVERAMRRAEGRALFVWAIARPEVYGAVPQLALLPSTEELALQPLDDAAALEFVRAMLPDGSGAIHREIVQRSDGSPLFLEELVRHAAVHGPATLPLTVLAMLHARVERLAKEPRRLLRAASVLGRTFWAGAVAYLLGDAEREGAGLTEELDALVAAELIEHRAGGRFHHQPEYRFRQSLLRDAVYATFTDDDRRTGHRLAAEWLERAGEHNPLVLAEHFERGGAPERAAQFFLRASHTALDGHDVTAALELAKRARASAEHLVETLDADALKGEIALAESEALTWLGDFAAAELAATEAMELLERGSASWFRAISHAIAASGRRGAYDLAIDWQDAVATAEAASADAAYARLSALCGAARQLFHAGGYDVASELIEHLARALESEDHPLALAELYRVMGAQARHIGDLAGDIEYYESALAAFERAGDTRNACNARVSVGFAMIEIGYHEEAHELLDEALAQADRLGLLTVQNRASQNLGLLMTYEGRFDDAVALLERVVRDSHAHGNVRFEGWSRIYLSRALLGAGLTAKSDAEHDRWIDRALAEASEAARLLEVTPPARAGALAMLALTHLAAIGRDRASSFREAEIHARGALAVLETFGGIEEFESLVWLAAVQTARAAGDLHTARERVRAAIARLHERTEAIPDPDVRTSFLTRVQENAELAALAEALDPPVEGGVPPASVRRAYATDLFRADARLIVDAIERHLADSMRGEVAVMSELAPPDAMLARFDHAFAPDPAPEGTLGAIVDALLASASRQHHPRYLGYQLSAPLPRAAAVTMLGSILNSGMAAFDSGPAPTAMERRVCDWMLGLVPWPEGSGVLTSGGSLGNLTALLAARRSVHERETARPAILVGEHAHYSIDRAARVMGLDGDAVIPLASDASYRIDPRAIGPAVEAARSRGLHPFALVASAGSTGPGAIDPLDAIADECDRIGVWLHVDGAHGASALLSEGMRPALDGIERARSLVWDAHKLLAMPALVTGVLFAKSSDSYATFAQRAAYLFEERDGEPWYDIGRRTVECTKPLLALPLYVCLATHGTRVLKDAVEHGLALARALAQRLEAAPDFELLTRPDLNILCFRHRPVDAAVDLDAHQLALRMRLKEDGAFFLVSTVLQGRTWLRATLMSPTTRESDLDVLLARLREAAVAISPPR